MLVSCLFVLLGLVLLVYSADIFVNGASGIARQLGVPPLIIGLTVVGFATSAPEIIVGSVSAWQGKTAIAIGNALGSNITNIGLVLGLSVILLPVTVTSNTIKREYGLMCFAIFVALILMMDNYRSRYDAMILLIVLGLSIGWVTWMAKQTSADDPLESEFTLELSKTDTLKNAIKNLLLGLVLLLIVAELLVRGAVFIAEYFGVSDRVIGLSIVEFG